MSADSAVFLVLQACRQSVVKSGSYREMQEGICAEEEALKRATVRKAEEKWNQKTDE